MNEKLSRRDVIKGSAAAAASIASVPSFAGRLPKTEGAQDPKRRPRVGVIGSGGKGWSGMTSAAEHGDIVAICDVDFGNRTKAMAEYPKAVSFIDYREMIDMMADRMDAVVVSTPDHHHYLASALALKADLHVYCEKPLTRTISEARELANLARKHKRITQMGNQSTAQDAMRQTAALLRRQEFGAVKEVHLWTDRAGGWWKQGIDRPQAELPPKELDFDLWIGPRPVVAYGRGYHPFSWRGFWDYGTGSLGDMGCHIFNMPFMGLDLRDPLAVQAKTSGHNRVSFPSWSIVDYEFGARGGRAPLKLTWYDGGQKPPASLWPHEEFGGNGVLVVCEKDAVYGPSADNNEFRLLSKRALPDAPYTKSPGHMAEFMSAIGGGPVPVSNFPDYAGPLAETVLLGNLAIWAGGTRVEWDAKAMRTKGTEEFNELIYPSARRGWSA